MKKYFIMIMATIVTYQGIIAISDKQMIAELNSSATQYEQSGLEYYKNNIMTPQAKQWQESFMKANAFVMEKSKRFARSQDADIVKAMNIMDVVNGSIAYLVTSLTGHVDPKVKLKSIQNDITKAMNMVSRSHRTEAKNVIIALGLAFTRFTQVLAQKINKM